MTLRVVVVYPDLLGTYGDGGNGLVLARRAEWRGIEAELIQAPSDAPVPRGDLYCLGGGEDGPQAQAADALRRDGTLAAAVGDGAVVLAVCAGFQIVGNSFPSAAGDTLAGLGLLDVDTAKGVGPRAVGELVAQPLDWGLPTLTGFENHAGTTVLAGGVRPLAAVEQGVGNGGGDYSEGAWSGRLIGTYLHGPVLARNPALADVLIGWATGVDTLAPLDDEREMLLRSERLGAARGARRRR
jgi:CobQ-like glutamine amidotransferase family enzyme